MALPTSATVNTSSITVVVANSARRGLIIRNISSGSKTISLGFNGDTAILNNGVTLYTGDAFAMDNRDVTTGAVTAICSASGGVLAIQEF